VLNSLTEVLYMPYIGKEKAADTVIESISPEI
jgi:hypothetical protein